MIRKPIDVISMKIEYEKIRLKTETKKENILLLKNNIEQYKIALKAIKEYGEIK